MPQSPKPPTDSVIPSAMPSMAAAGLETTLSMARTLVHPTRSPRRSTPARGPIARRGQRPTHTRYACGRGTSEDSVSNSGCVRPWIAMPTGDDVRAVDDRPARLCRRHEEPVPPPLLSSRSPAAAEAQREAGREAQRRTPAAIAGTRTRGDRAAASATYRAQRPHRGPRHRHPLGGVPRLGAVQRLEQRHPGGQQPVRRPAGRQERLQLPARRVGQPRGTHPGAAAGAQRRRLGRGQAHRLDHPRARPRQRRQGRDDLDPPRLLRPDPRTRQQQDQRGVCLRWRQAADPDRRAGHRRARRRLPRDRVRRLRRRRRQPRWRRRLRPVRHEGPGRRHRPEEGLPDPRRADRPRLRPRPQVRPARRHRPGRAAAPVPRRAAEEGGHAVDRADPVALQVVRRLGGDRARGRRDDVVQRRREDAPGAAGCRRRRHPLAGRADRVRRACRPRTRASPSSGTPRRPRRSSTPSSRTNPSRHRPRGPCRADPGGLTRGG